MVVAFTTALEAVGECVCQFEWLLVCSWMVELWLIFSLMSELTLMRCDKIRSRNLGVLRALCVQILTSRMYFIPPSV